MSTASHRIEVIGVPILADGISVPVVSGGSAPSLRAEYTPATDDPPYRGGRFAKSAKPAPRRTKKQTKICCA